MPAWQRNDPMRHDRPAWCPTARASGSTAATATRPTSTAGLGNAQVPAQFLEGLTIRTNHAISRPHYDAGWVGGNGVFNFPPTGTHSWGYWGGQLQAMKPDIQRVLGAAPTA